MTYIQQIRAKMIEVQEILNKMEEEQKKDPQLKIILPFSGKYPITQYFGVNPQIYQKFGYKGHFGIDFGTPHGTEILAVDDGEIERAGRTDGNGNFIEIKHAWGSTLYMHMRDSPTQKLYQQIKKGEVIGHAGNTGYVIPQPTKKKPLAGTHLHFSLRINGMKNEGYKDFIDPLPYFKNIQDLL